MKIYHISNSGQKAEKKELYEEFARLGKAAGCENLCRFTIEEICDKTDHDDPWKLAFMHIDDSSPVLESIADDPDFIKAERLSLMAELSVRILHTSGGIRIYRRAADSVIEKL